MDPVVDLSAAMADLRAGVEHSQVERVSRGYLVLRQAGMSLGEVLTLAGEAMGEQALLRHRLSEMRQRRRTGPSPAGQRTAPRGLEGLGSIGRSALSMVALACAAGTCPWCDGGSDPCAECDATGRADGRACRACGGTGRIECGFCGGTCWSLTPTPPELTRHVQRLRRRHVRDALRQAGRCLAGLTRDDVHLLGERRGDLLTELVRLRAQLAGLSACGGPHHDRIVSELWPLQRKAQQYIDLLAE